MDPWLALWLVALAGLCVFTVSLLLLTNQCRSLLVERVHSAHWKQMYAEEQSRRQCLESECQVLTSKLGQMPRYCQTRCPLLQRQASAEKV